MSTHATAPAPPSEHSPRASELTASRRRLGLAAVAALALLLLIVLLRTAWMCDDAYITLRTVDNLLNGHGLRWNTFERVQAYTHPLWMLVMAGAVALTREHYHTILCLSMALTLGSALLATRRLTPTPAAAALLLLVLILSRAFIDYATSGLENPLSHLLLAIFLILYLHRAHDARTLFYLTLVAALAAVNRLDTVLFYAPPLAWVLWQTRSWRAVGLAALGLAPLLAWELFALFYYGFPFPNTAYAKLGNGIPAVDLIAQGIAYLANALHWDPITPLVIAAGCIAPALAHRRTELPCAAGVLLYLLYVLWIGGDFMSGRFLTAPLFVSAVLLARTVPSWGNRQTWAGLAALLALGLLGEPPTLLSGADFGTGDHAKAEHGIADEREFYFDETGLLGAHRQPGRPLHTWGRHGAALQQHPDQVAIVGSIGFMGFYAGPEVRLIDYHALADPLLARIPRRRLDSWRIGHYIRGIPPGYQATVRDRANRLEDPRLAAYYDHLSLITRGPLLAPARWRAIWHMNLGHYDHLIDQEQYRERPEETYRPLTPAPEGWHLQPGQALRVPFDGLVLQAPAALHCAHIDIAVIAGTRPLEGIAFDSAGARSAMLPLPQDDRTHHRVEVPGELARQGYTSLRLTPTLDAEYPYVHGNREPALHRLALSACE